MSEAPGFFEVEPDERRALPAELGRYVLLEELGSGGMASVYLGKMRLTGGLERLVAVKTIHDHLAHQPSFVDMFLDEASIATQITHPNVCSVHDFGEVGGTYYLAMEYLVGEPLSEVVRRLQDGAAEEGVADVLPFLAARVVADACEGLHAAHETRGTRGQRLEVVHRDVSPQNLFVTYDGAVKVVDFGCAKAIQRITQTSAGIFKGKVAYAAPEQLKIEPLDARTDVWALGVCLWEALTLRRLFKREAPMATARAVLSEPIPRADDVEPSVPPELADVAQRALARDPMDRYQSAREMGRDLRRFIARWGAVFESAELAEWMEYLFDERRTRLLRRVEEVEASLGSQVVATGPAAAPQARTETAPAEVLRGDEPPKPPPEPAAPPARSPAAPPPRRAPAEPSPERPISRPLRLAEEDRREAPPSDRSALWWAVPAAIVLVTAVTLLAIYLAALVRS
jgi:serine/threonine-protein kinase